MFQFLVKPQSAALPSRERSKILLCDTCVIWRRWLKTESQEDACGVQEAAERRGTRGAAGAGLGWKQKEGLLAPSHRSVPKSRAVGAAAHHAEPPAGFQPLPHQGCVWAASLPAERAAGRPGAVAVLAAGVLTASPLPSAFPRRGRWRVGWLLCASCGLQESGTSLVLWAFSSICTSIFSVFLNMILCFSWLV